MKQNISPQLDTDVSTSQRHRVYTLSAQEIINYFNYILPSESGPDTCITLADKLWLDGQKENGRSPLDAPRGAGSNTSADHGRVRRHPGHTKHDNTNNRR